MPEPIGVLELRSVRGTGGGPEKTILLGAARSDPARVRVTVAYLRDDRDPVFGIDTWAAKLGIDYAEIRERHSFDPGIWKPLTALVRERGIQIVHAHDYKTNLLALMLARRTGVVPLATEHGWTGHSWRERAVYYRADKWLARFFPRIVAVSENIREELVRHGVAPDRVTTVLNGIDPAAFCRDRHREREVRASLEIADSDIVIGSAGRLEPQKRFDLLVEAVSGLTHALPRLRLFIAGEGSERPRLEALQRRPGIGNRVTLLGHRTDIARLHHAFDLYVQSSDYEGTPNSVLEAMAMETPIVATDAGGTRQLVTDAVHALVVRTGSSVALTDAIRAALSAPGASAVRARAARLRVEGPLSFAARTERLEGLYRSLLNDSRVSIAPTLNVPA